MENRSHNINKYYLLTIYSYFIQIDLRIKSNNYAKCGLLMLTYLTWQCQSVQWQSHGMAWVWLHEPVMRSSSKLSHLLNTAYTHSYIAIIGCLISWQNYFNCVAHNSTLTLTWRVLTGDNEIHTRFTRWRLWDTHYKSPGGSYFIHSWKVKKYWKYLS